MSIVTLASGGLDSTVMAVLAAEAGVEQYPLFINYGQRSVEQELAACRRNFSRLKLPEPHVADLRGFGIIARSGLTDGSLDTFVDAFTPGRNLLFLTAAAAYLVTRGADAIAIGLLTESAALFPDQTTDFLKAAEATVAIATGRQIRVLAPLMHCAKMDVIALARRHGIDATYSCHVGGTAPCGHCIACREFLV